MNPHYPQVAQRASHQCEYCRAPEAMFNFPFEVEHIVPVSEGGENLEDNFALSCRSCNLFKGIFIRAIDPETKSLTDLFHPRHDLWYEHFDIDSGSSEIVGRSPAGRATVERLNMNSDAQLSARRQWMRLGLFP